MDTTARHGVTRRRRGRASRFGLGSKHVLAGLCAFAILFQLLVIQTHVHAAPAQSAPAAQFASVADGSTAAGEQAGPDKSKLPADGSRNECFICQQMALAGSAILPNVIEPVLIRQETETQATFVVVAATRASASHSWRSRAPPTQI